jgi:hypothetical protein
VRAFLLAGAFAAGVAACVGSSTADPPPTSAADGDAGVAGDASGDAGAAAAPTDASSDASAPKGVRITTLRWGLPVGGVHVIFRDPEAKLPAVETVTDATGRASVPVARSEVTVLDPPGYGYGGDSFITYVAVEDGDELTAQLSTQYAETAFGPARKLAVTRPPDVVNASQYDVFAGSNACRNDPSLSDAPIAVDVTECARPLIDVVAFARGASGESLGTSFVKAVPYPPAGGTTPVALPAWSAPSPALVSVTNVTSGADVILRHVVNEVAYSFDAHFFGTDGTFSTSFRSANGFADDYDTVVTVGDSSYSALAIHRRDSPAAPLSFDLAQALPWIDSAALSPATPGTIGAMWAPASTVAGTTGGVVVVRLTYNAGSEAIRYGGWAFVVPPGATSVSTVIPGSVAALLATARRSNVDVTFVQSDATTPKAFRNAPLPWVARGGVLPQRGTLRSTFGSFLVPN